VKTGLISAAFLLLSVGVVHSAPPEFPPKLPGDKAKVTVAADKLLARPGKFPADIAIAKTAPKIEFVYYPGQTYAGNPWSHWGDGSFAKGKFYSAIGDHLAPRGNAFVYEFDPATTKFRLLTNTSELLKLPTGHYSPGKIHTHVDLGKDGIAYFATHRGSTRVTTDANHFAGEWILSADPVTGKSAIVDQPILKHCIPNGRLDPQRLIFYGGTAPGVGDANTGRFFAYDIANKKVLFDGANGPSREIIISSSTGMVYYTPGTSDTPLMRFDPTSGKAPSELPLEIGIRAATNETPQGIVYTISQGHKGTSEVFSFDCKAEKVAKLGLAAVGQQQYIAAVEADPTGRYLYYVPGAHGGSEVDGSPIVQFDTKTRTRKVIAFLHPALQESAGCISKGCYGLGIDATGGRLCVMWNVNRTGAKAWDTVGLAIVDIPESERKVD